MQERFAGVDVGGTNIALAVGDREGRVEVEASLPTQGQEGAARVLARIGEWLRAQGGVQGVGLGLPGTLDRERGVVEFLPNLPGHWRGVEAGRMLGEQVGVPVHILNDARMATLGELHYGAGRGQKGMTMVFFTLGTGVGGGVVVEGKLRLGKMGAAGEVGHQTILPEGPRCGCGKNGCLEALAAAPAIVGEAVRLLRSGLAPGLAEMVGRDWTRVTPKEVAAASAVDEPVRELVERVAKYLGIAVANAIHILHPEAVLFGGGVAAMGETLLGPLRAEVRRSVRMFSPEGVRIERSELGERAGTLGGIALAAAEGRI